MQRKKSGPAAVEATASPEQPGRISENHQTPAYYTRTDQPCHYRTYDAPLRTWTDALAFCLFVTLAVAVAFIALYMLIAVLFVLGQAAS